MGDLFSLSIEVSTPSTALEINDHEAFEIVEWNPPIQEVSRVVVDGPYQSGRRLISATRGPVTLTGVVRVLGEDWQAARDNAESLFSALSQFSFTLTESIEGEDTVYDCEPADISLASGLDGFQVARGRHEYVLSIPCSRAVVEGS